MSLRDAAQQALEALGLAKLNGKAGLHPAEIEEIADAITNLRAALAEPDLFHCPKCGGPADNGHDRSIPPSPYWCTKCMAEPVQECPNCASLQDQNTELDRKLAELQGAVLKANGVG